MRWMLKFRDGSVFTSESMIDTNNQMIEKGSPIIMEIKHLDKLFKVDYDNGNIYCNGDIIFENSLDIEPRWVSYREVIAQIGTNTTPKIVSKTYFFGWQATLNGSEDMETNIKRLISIDPVGNTKLVILPEMKDGKKIT